LPKNALAQLRALVIATLVIAGHCRGSDEVDSSGETISPVPRNPFRDSCDKAAGTVVHASG
jgi:hypothetical protein